jgi:hypothetical protein
MISPKHKFSGKFTKETHVVGGVCISPKHKFSGKFTKETGGVF